MEKNDEQGNATRSDRTWSAPVLESFDIGSTTAFGNNLPSADGNTFYNS